MKFGTSLLRSKVSRRLFVLFVFSGLFPIALFALLSFGYVNQQLVSYAKREIHQDSKAVGMEILGRLSTAEAELKQLTPETDEYSSKFSELIALEKEIKAKGGPS